MRIKRGVDRRHRPLLSMLFSVPNLIPYLQHATNSQFHSECRPLLRATDQWGEIRSIRSKLRMTRDGCGVSCPFSLAERQLHLPRYRIACLAQQPSCAFDHGLKMSSLFAKSSQDRCMKRDECAAKPRGLRRRWQICCERPVR